MTRLRQGSAGQAPLREGSAGQAPLSEPATAQAAAGKPDARRWPAETLDAIRAWCAEGLPASAIALRLGVTRSAVIGQITRHQLRGWGVTRLRQGSAGQAPGPQRRGAPKRPLEAEARRNAGRVALRRHAEEPEPRGPVGAFATGCRWIHGEVAAGDWRCCGHDTEPGSPWCPHHASRVYNTAATAQSRKI